MELRQTLVPIPAILLFGAFLVAARRTDAWQRAAKKGSNAPQVAIPFTSYLSTINT